MSAQSAPKIRSIASSFAELRGRIGLIPFIPAGYPDLETTAATLRSLDATAPAAIEVGFPFSDPIADGPTIQQAFTAALSRKLKVGQVFAAVKSAQPLQTPLVAMISYSIVYRYGIPRFLGDARQAGLGGLILPDLPPPEAQRVCKQVREAGLDTILLVAPTTPPQRRAEIVQLCSGFVYYLAVSGITGARAELPPDVAENVDAIKKLTDKPVCVGFGISQPRHVAALRGLADGAIVGSAIVKRMTDLKDNGADAVARAVADYCRELMSESSSGTASLPAPGAPGEG